MNGFATKTMSLEVTSMPKLSLTWTNPPDALFVACAIFTCNPAIREREIHNESDESPTDETKLWRIANAEACMFELHVADTPRSSLPLDGRQRQFIDPPCATNDTHERVIDFFAAGCWAYDTNRVIAASELVPIAASDMSRVTPVAPIDATCARDAEPCFDADHQFYGACLAGRCEPRCTSPEDCEIAARQLLNEPSSSTCNWECQRVPTSLVGICAPRADPILTGTW